MRTSGTAQASKLLDAPETSGLPGWAGQTDQSSMQAVTLKEAKRNLPRLIEQVLDDAEPRIVVDEQGRQVVVEPLDEFNSYRETLHQLSNPANAAHLRRAIAEAEAGQFAPHELVGEYT